MAKIFVALILLFNVLQPSTGISLDGNGYTDILVAINPAVPESELLIKQIQDMITNGSKYLHQALDNKVFFKEVKILVPPNWNNGTYERARRETYEAANIIISDPHPSFGDEPYTNQKGACGEEGDFIHFTQNFILNDTLVGVYGPKGRVFVHEWAHLRWGVYDEYNKKNPFYLSNGEIQPTRCTSKVSGQWYELINGIPQDCRIGDNGLPTNECLFFPDQQQDTNASIMFMQSLDTVKAFCQEEDHNTLAPNDQNKKCDRKATRTVIFQDSVDKDAFRILVATQSPPPIPTFKVIQRKTQVTCLILDVSGSMRGERIRRLLQAATVFLSQVVEDDEYVGIVTFSTNANVLSHLVKIDGKAARDRLISILPRDVAGSTNMCQGLARGFEVLGEDNKSTQGDYVIFLTDGEATDNVELCLPSAVNSGAIISTLALGPSASNVLFKMANLTDGKFRSADQTLTSNALVNAFSAMRMSDGNSIKQTIQIESTGMSVTDWFNGTLPIDQTVGRNTTFTLIYERTSPSVYVQSPNGAVYDQSNVTDDTAAKTISLRIPGTAEPGNWKYSFLNKEPAAQGMALTVTSRPVSEDVPPVTVKAEISQVASNGINPLVVYAEVTQNYIPVLGATVFAKLQSDTGNSEILQLLDNGAGADAFKDDGTYSRYFTKLRNGRYSLSVRMTKQSAEGGIFPNRYSGALYIPGYIVNGTVNVNPPKPPVSVQPVEVGDISRTTTGESFVVSLPPGTTPPNFPPNKITDLTAEIQEDTVLLNWTAPGEDFDQGTAASYEIRWSESLDMLLNNFSSSNLANTSGLLPQEAGSNEQFSFMPNISIPNGTTLFFAIRSEDNDTVKSEVSTIAQATNFIPSPIIVTVSTPRPRPPATVPTPRPRPPATVPTPRPRPPAISYEGLNLTVLVVSACGLAILLCLIAIVLMLAVNRRKVKPSPMILINAV